MMSPLLLTFSVAGAAAVVAVVVLVLTAYTIQSEAKAAALPPTPAATQTPTTTAASDATPSTDKNESLTPTAATYDTDVIIVGAGTAGATLAIQLARQNRRVTLIERDMEIPHRIVGELLQPGGVRCLERMNLASTIQPTNTSSIPVYGYVVFPSPNSSSSSSSSSSSASGSSPKTNTSNPTKELLLRYPTEDPSTIPALLGVNVTPTPLSSPPGATSPQGMSFWNHNFVENLRNVARAEPNITFLHGSVRALERDSTGTITGVTYVPTVTPTDAATPQPTPSRVTLHAPLTIPADGYYSIFRKHLSTSSPATASYFCGLILNHPEGETPLPFPNHGHVILCEPNPVLLYQVSPTETRILIDVPAPMPSVEDGSLKRYFLDTVVPQLPPKLQKTVRHASETQEPQCMPNRAMPASSPTASGAFLLGDAYSTRHPLTGGGMTVALRDVELLSACLRGVSLTDQAAVAAAHAKFASLRVPHASTVNVLANALHRVFTVPAGDTGTRQRLRDACYAYLSCGAASTAGPVGLLSALTPSPTVLTSHFFLVAAYAMRHAVFPFPTPTRLKHSYDLLRVACAIILPMLESEKATVLSSRPLLMLTNAMFRWRVQKVA